MAAGGAGCPRCEGLIEKIPLRTVAEYFRHLEQVKKFIPEGILTVSIFQG